MLADTNRERIRTILEAAVADSNVAPGSGQRRIGDFYSACMDTAAIDARGLAPLPSVIAANPAMRDHFKTGQVSRAQDLQLF
jgi:predicted metalloendopeptidase